LKRVEFEIVALNVFQALMLVLVLLTLMEVFRQCLVRRSMVNVDIYVQQKPFFRILSVRNMSSLAPIYEVIIITLSSSKHHHHIRHETWLQIPEGPQKDAALLVPMA
jgi:hypothetical protein